MRYCYPLGLEAFFARTAGVGCGTAIVAAWSLSSGSEIQSARIVCGVSKPFALRLRANLILGRGVVQV